MAVGKHRVGCKTAVLSTFLLSKKNKPVHNCGIWTANYGIWPDSYGIWAGLVPCHVYNTIGVHIKHHNGFERVVMEGMVP